MSLTKIITGGQTGVDRGAMDAALEACFPCGGWCPPGRAAEDGAIPDRYPMTEMSSGTYLDRTIQNVVDSDATVIIYFSTLHGGTEQTLLHCAQRMKRYTLIDGSEIEAKRAAELIAHFITEHDVSILNVAGPRGSDAPRAHQYAHEAIGALLRAQNGRPSSTMPTFNSELRTGVNRSFRVRQATVADADALLAIYRPFVERTTISFETTAPTADQFAARIEKALAGWQWLVAEEADRCIGYAYGGLHRERAAYRWSVEVSAYVHPSHHRRGVARTLYTQLFADLARLGYCNAYAGITLPNEASEAMHRDAGFEFVGAFRAVGRKFGQWHDVAWYQRMLRDAPPFD
jgi:phosphinothricin acetyltransferase